MGPKIIAFRHSHKETVLNGVKAGQFLDPILGPVFGPKKRVQNQTPFLEKNSCTASGIAEVVDLSPPSGAMAAVAAMNHIVYDGFCFNDMHKQ